METRNCKFCGKEFSYQNGRGLARIHCSKQCAQGQGNKNASEKLLTVNAAICKVDGCNKVANRVGSGLCESHYMRLRRRGTTDKKEYPIKTFNQAGYAKIKNKEHPLSYSDGTVYEHRFVYYSNFGEGPFLCHWCKKPVSWYDMHIDHLDDNITNNQISNLVASCPVCNQARGRHKMIKKRRDRGINLTYNGETMCLSEWAKRLGITHQSLFFRLKSGWSVERALSTPRGITGPKRKKGLPQG